MYDSAGAKRVACASFITVTVSVFVLRWRVCKEKNLGCTQRLRKVRKCGIC